MYFSYDPTEITEKMYLCLAFRHGSTEHVFVERVFDTSREKRSLQIFLNLLLISAVISGKSWHDESFHKLFVTVS